MVYAAAQCDVDLGRLAGDLRPLGVRGWVYLGEDTTWRVQAEADALRNLPRILIADELDKTSWQFRQPYIDWMGELSRLNGSQEWWASELAAKNPYSSLFIRICSLAVCAQLIETGIDCPTLFVCSTRALASEVRRTAVASGVSAREFRNTGLHTRTRMALKPHLRELYRSSFPWAARWLAPILPRRFAARVERDLRASPCHRREILGARGLSRSGGFTGKDTVLLFTWVDRRNFAVEGQFLDPHLGPLAQMLEARGYRVGYVPQILMTIPFEEALGRMLRTEVRFFFPDLYVAEEDRRKCKARARAFTPIVPHNSSVLRVSVGSLVQEHVEEHCDKHAQTLTYEHLIANLKSAGVYPHRVIHTCEGHSWEQCLASSVRCHMPGTRVVGYENGTFSRMVHSEFPACSEFGNRPLPDTVVTYGPLSRDILVDGGWPETRVRSGCALRHSYLWSADGASSSEQHQSPAIARILVATGIGLGETVELIDKAARAFGDRAGYELLVKCHPTVNQESIEQQMSGVGIPTNLSYVDAPICELLPKAHILLYTYTSVCYEALKYGVFPIFVRAENSLNLDKLDFVPDVREVATTPEDIRRAADDALQMSANDRQAWQGRGLSTLRAAFAPIGPDCVDAFLA